jgi:hypothetical protein
MSDQTITSKKIEENKFYDAIHYYSKSNFRMLIQIISLILLTTGSSFYHNHDNKILLADVNTLSLHSKKYTTGQRVQPIPQLNCESGYCSHGPVNVLCENMGPSSSSNDHRSTNFIWKCTGYGMSPGYKLRYSDVSCEGYDHKSDPYVLDGSCAVFYAVDKDYSYVKPKVTVTKTTTMFPGTVRYPYHNDQNTDYLIVFFIMCVFFVTFYLIHRIGTFHINHNPDFSWYNYWPRPWTRWSGYWTSWTYPRSYHLTDHLDTTRTMYSNYQDTTEIYESDNTGTTSTTTGNTRMR